MGINDQLPYQDYPPHRSKEEDKKMAVTKGSATASS